MARQTLWPNALALAQTLRQGYAVLRNAAPELCRAPRTFYAAFFRFCRCPGPPPACRGLSRCWRARPAAGRTAPDNRSRPRRPGPGRRCRALSPGRCRRLAVRHHQRQIRALRRKLRLLRPVRPFPNRLAAARLPGAAPHRAGRRRHARRRRGPLWLGGFRQGPARG